MRFFLVLTVFLMFSCSLSEVKPTPPNGKFLSIADIEELFDQEVYNTENDPASKDDLLRMSTLIDENELFKNSGRAFVEETKLPESKDSTSDDEEIKEIKAVDLRNFAQPVVNQWNGTCTAHATAAAVEGLYKMQTGKDLKLSERHLWSKYGKYNATDAMNAMKNNFIAENKYWPHASATPISNDVDKKAVIKIPHYYYVGDNNQEFFKGFYNGMIGKIAMRVPYEMVKCRKIIRDTSAPVDGGHDIAVYGIIQSAKHGLIAILKNSWGESCGDYGFQYLQLSICQKKDYYCMLYLIDKYSTKP